MTYHCILRFLSECPYIASAASKLSIAPESKIEILTRGYVKFTLFEDQFLQWKRDLETEIGVTFRRNRLRRYNRTGDKKVNEIFLCNRSGKAPDLHREPKKPVKAAQGRFRLGSRCGCLSRINKVQTSRSVGDISIEVIEVKVLVRHNHDICDKSTVGSRRVSAETKNWIMRQHLEGVSCKDIKRKHNEANEFKRQEASMNGIRPNHDHYLSYMDVYNIYFKLFNTAARKHQDPRVSLRMWVEDLKNDGYFTFLDEASGSQHCGFASTWQIDQLLHYGHTVCFDGTHNVFGFVSFFVFFLSPYVRLVWSKANPPITLSLLLGKTLTFTLLLQNIRAVDLESRWPIF